MEVLLIYLFAMNIIGFLVMGYDKYCAKHNRWRVPEKTIFITALLGGSPGATLGMYCFRHKTRHWYFKFGLPLICVCQVSIFYVVFW